MSQFTPVWLQNNNPGYIPQIPNTSARPTGSDRAILSGFNAQDIARIIQEQLTQGRFANEANVEARNRAAADIRGSGVTPELRERYINTLEGRRFRLMDEALASEDARMGAYGTSNSGVGQDVRNQLRFDAGRDIGADITEFDLGLADRDTAKQTAAAGIIAGYDQPQPDYSGLISLILAQKAEAAQAPIQQLQMQQLSGNSPEQMRSEAAFYARNPTAYGNAWQSGRVQELNRGGYY